MTDRWRPCAWLALLLVACGEPIAAEPIDASMDVGLDAPAMADVPVAPDVSDFDASVEADAGAADGDAGPEPTAAEREACANLVALTCTGDPPTVDGCLASFVTRRGNAEPDCLPEYDAFVACMAALTCPSAGTGPNCTTEYSALGTCIMARP